MFQKIQRIIDFGCGTGIVGQLVHDNGFTLIYGVDASIKMLEVLKRVCGWVKISKISKNR